MTGGVINKTKTPTVCDKASPTSPNVSWQQGLVNRNQRWANMGQQGATLWFTGLSGAGKSTLVFTLEEMLLGLRVKTCVLDGDNLRHGLNSDLGFSLQDRTENVRRVGEVSRLCAEAGLLALSSFISPRRADRDRVRQMHQDAQLRFIEIHVDTPLAICEQRDPKGLYRRARAGEIKGFTGIDSPYEIPEHADLIVTHGDSPAGSCGRIIRYLQQQGLAPAS